MVEIRQALAREFEIERRGARLRSGFDVIFSSKWSWVNLIQYDNVSDTAGVNLRLHWIPQAGREVFFVINQNLEDFDTDGSFHSLVTDYTAKVSYTFRF